MAKRQHILVGLDIDPSGIAVAEVSTNGHVAVQRAAVAPLEGGIVRDGEVHDVAGLADALRALFREHKGLGNKVRVGVASQKIVVRVVELPALVDRAELDAAVRFLAQDEIPMPVDSTVLDYRLLDVVDNGGGRRQRVLLVAARRDMVARLLAAVRAAGLKPEGIDLAAFGMIRALFRPPMGDEPILYLSIGGLTNLAVARGALCLFTRSFGGGIEALATELAERRGLTLEHARAWLDHVGLTTPLEDVEGDEDIVHEARRVLIAGVRRIATEIRTSLDYHLAQGTDGAVTRALLTGPVTAIPGFAAALRSELGLEVEESVLEVVPAGIDPGRIATAAGLAISEVPAA